MERPARAELTVSAVSMALVVSEEHFLCSGANRYVYINMLLTSAVFFMFFAYLSQS